MYLFAKPIIDMIEWLKKWVCELMGDFYLLLKKTL